MQNKTTVEYHEGVTAHAHYRELGQKFSHPYDVGVSENICQVLGHQWQSWLMPKVSLAGDGLRYPHSLGAAIVTATRQRLAASGSSSSLEPSIQLTDRKGERKRDVYADELESVS